jgi:hypothetical protein
MALLEIVRGKHVHPMVYHLFPMNLFRTGGGEWRLGPQQMVGEEQHQSGLSGNIVACELGDLYTNYLAFW